MHLLLLPTKERKRALVLLEYAAGRRVHRLHVPIRDVAIRRSDVVCGGSGCEAGWMTV
jgi:hypothetical protein